MSSIESGLECLMYQYYVWKFKQESDCDQQQQKHDEEVSSCSDLGDNFNAVSSTSNATVATKYRKIVALIETEFPQIVAATSNTASNINPTTTTASSKDDETLAEQQQQQTTSVTSELNNISCMNFTGKTNNHNSIDMNVPELYRIYWHRDQFISRNDKTGPTTIDPYNIENYQKIAACDIIQKEYEKDNNIDSQLAVTFQEEEELNNDDDDSDGFKYGDVNMFSTIERIVSTPLAIRSKRNLKARRNSYLNAANGAHVTPQKQVKKIRPNIKSTEVQKHKAQTKKAAQEKKIADEKRLKRRKSRAEMIELQKIKKLREKEEDEKWSTQNAEYIASGQLLHEVGLLKRLVIQDQEYEHHEASEDSLTVDHSPKSIVLSTPEKEENNTIKKESDCIHSVTTDNEFGISLGNCIPYTSPRSASPSGTENSLGTIGGGGSCSSTVRDLSRATLPSLQIGTENTFDGGDSNLSSYLTKSEPTIEHSRQTMMPKLSPLSWKQNGKVPEPPSSKREYKVNDLVYKVDDIVGRENMTFGFLNYLMNW